MAEYTLPIATQSVGVSFKDGAGTPATYTPPAVVKASITGIGLDLARDKEEILTQAGGQALIYDALDNGIAGGGDVTIKYVITDLKDGAGTERTLIELNRVLYNPTLKSSTGFTGWTSTNPTTGASHFMVTLVLTFYNAIGSGSNRVYSTPVFIMTGPPTLTIEGQHYVQEVTYRFPQAWTRT